MASVILPAGGRTTQPHKLRTTPRAPATPQQPLAPRPLALSPSAQQPAQQPAWTSPFSAAESQRLLDDDRFAGAAIAVILVSIFVLGLVLTIGAIWLAP
jgi:hypothetical protein